MSTDKLKELKLYKKLERDLTYREKLQQKIRQISNGPAHINQDNLTKKLNNNKKYLQQEERNSQIQRQNKILFQKIQSKGQKSQYRNQFRSRNRSSKTLNSIENDQNQRFDKNQRKYKNMSQNKIQYQQEQSRISFQENQELIRPKQNSKKKKLTTQLSSEIIEMFRSRMRQTKVQNREIILFQGIAEIDSIRFKVKIVIKDKAYHLTGKNKHTQIMLKMQLNEYRKFHKEVLMGNPSNIFQYLVIDKGKIRFRTLQEQLQAEHIKKQKIYQIDEEQEEDNEQIYKKYRQTKKISIPMVLKYQNEQNFIQSKYGKHKYSNFQNLEQVNSPINYSQKLFNKARSIQKLKRKENIISNSNKRQKSQQQDKYKTLEDYINGVNEQENEKNKKILKSYQIDIKNLGNRYKLPYI